MNDKIVEVILPLPPGTPFYYKVPEHLWFKCKPGKRVIVPFGKKIFTGIIFKVSKNLNFSFNLREIISIVDDEIEIVTEKQIEIFNWLAEYYLITPGEIINFSIPSDLLPENEIVLSLNEDLNFENLNLTEKEKDILNVLKNLKSFTFKALRKKIKSKSLLKDLNQLKEKGIIFLNDFIKESKEKTIKYVRLKYKDDEKLSEILESLKRSKKQQQVINYLIDLYYSKGISEVPFKDLVNVLKKDYEVINKMKEKNFIEIIEKPAYPSSAKFKKIELNQEKKKFKNSLLQSLNDKNVILIRSTFNSFEDIIFSTIYDFIEQKKEVILIFPEIHQVKKIYNKLSDIFGDIVVEYHSEITDKEKITVWKNLVDINVSETQRYKIFIGTRAILFLPYRNPGLIFVIGEHKVSYKEEYSLFFNFKDIAVALTKFYNLKVALIDVAPSFESYYNVLTKKYSYLRNINNLNNNFLLIDIRKLSYKKKMHLYFSDILLENIEKSLNDKKKVILIQNRKGFASFIQCYVCGFVEKCKNCDLTLVYHKDINKLVCHICGHKQDINDICPICFNKALVIKGIGTERIEEDISILFPEKKILRIDSETISLVKDKKDIIDKIEENDYDIIIATQVFVSFLNEFIDHNVGLIAFVDFDKFLNVPDFRAYEKAFQLLTEVYYSFNDTTIIIQTREIENVFYKFLRKDFSYENFLEFYLKERKEFFYPPFNRLIKIELSDKNKFLLIKAAEKLNKIFLNTEFKSSINFYFSADFIQKYEQYYFINFIIKLRKDKNLQDNKKTIKSCIDSFSKEFKSVMIKIDVDPL